MPTFDGDDAMSSSRPLMHELLRTSCQGIAAFVQQRVHSTVIGLEATTAFVQQLLAELEEATAAFTTTLHHLVQLSDQDELEIGTLISASSLAIRYVTEREAMAPVVTRFGQVFRSILRFPLWTNAMLGLKMVSLMGATRILESFGAFVSAEQELQDLRFTFALFNNTEDEQQLTMHLNYLLRPSTEHLTVAIQSHQSLQPIVAAEIVPRLMGLVARVPPGVSDAVAVELLATIAVLFDLRYPSPIKTAFTLLPVPAFANEEQDGDDDDASDNIHLNDQDDAGARESLGFVLPSDADLTSLCEVVVSWLEVDGRRRGVVANLPHVFSALRGATKTQTTVALFNALLASVRSVELHRIADFEFLQAALEALRDIARREAVPSAVDESIFTVINDAMPRLQGALKAVHVDKTELRAIKGVCSSTREVLVELIVWCIHHTTNASGNESLRVVLGKLADPRVYGDLLYVLHKSDDNTSRRLGEIDDIVVPLLRAVAQLDRYSKVAAGRILSGIARIAIGSGSSISKYADELGAPITRSLFTGHCKGKSRRQRINAAACILLTSVSDDDFQVDQRPWVLELIDALLDDSAALNFHSLAVLEHLAREVPRVRRVVAHVCATSSLEIVAHLVHNVLSAWPIFAEDADAVLLVLRVLRLLVRDDELRAVIDTESMSAVLTTLMSNAKDDDQSDLAEACREVLQALSE